MARRLVDQVSAGVPPLGAAISRQLCDIFLSNIGEQDLPKDFVTPNVT
jgi:hypothetical protein